MTSTFNFPAIYIANGFGILLSGIMLFGNLLKEIKRNRENRILSIMFAVSILSCFVDCFVFIYDGRAGLLAQPIVGIGNFWLFFSNLIMGPLWLELVIVHMYGKMPVFQRVLINTLSGLGAILLIVNIWIPLVYSIDASNVYHRGPLYALYTVFELALIIDGIVLYYIARANGGVYKFFPIMQFIVPFMAGMVPQFLWYGVSTIWAGASLSLCGLYNSLKNESLYTDSLTGLFNRYYLESIKNDMERVKGKKVTAMMMDLNGFKGINDKFGHSEGDEALIQVAQILKDTGGKLGHVIRYAGDEFVILLKSTNLDDAKTLEKLIQDNIKTYNENSGKGYEISLAIGYNSFDMGSQSIDDLLKEVDKRMYLDKKRYYENLLQNKGE